MKILFALLLAFLRPGAVGEGEPEDEPELDLAADDPPPSEQPDDETEREPPDTAAELEASRREAKEARDKAERFERELGELRRQPTQRQAPPQPDEQTARENQILADPNATELQKWQITANREIRAGRQFANNALVQAQDVNDKTAFAALAIKEPALFKRYETRVEEELTKLRATGQNAPREALFTFLLGKDMREGKFTRKKDATKPGAPSTVQRGRTPGARSDVAGHGQAKNEHEKRRARLENVQI